MARRMISMNTPILLPILMFLFVSFMPSGEAGAATCPYSFSYYSSNVIIPRSGDDGHPIKFVNRTNDDIWLGVLGRMYNESVLHGFDGPTPNPDGTTWKIPANNLTPITWCAPKTFISGRFWPRTGCKPVSTKYNGKTYNMFWCETGDCAKLDPPPAVLTSEAALSAYLANDQCVRSSTAVPLAEFTYDQNEDIYYDVSYVDGYNFPIEIVPSTTTTGCKVAGCQSLPNVCASGDYQNGICLAPYIVYGQNPANSYLDNYFAVSAKCADTSSGICDCAYTCDGRDGRPLKQSCPDEMLNVADKYSGASVNLLSSACSPINVYADIQNKYPDIQASMWSQIVCDPITGYGSMYAPYFDDGTTRARYRKTTSSPWAKGASFSFNAATDIPDFTTVSNYAGVINDAAVFVAKEDSGLDEDFGVHPATVTVNGTTVTVTLDSTKATIVNGQTWPITVNIPNTKYACHPWPQEMRQYTWDLSDACPNAYSWQYNDKGGLGKCLKNRNEEPADGFTLTFYPRTDNSINHSSDPIVFTPDTTVKVALTHKRGGSPDQGLTAIGPDTTTVPMKTGDGLSLTVFCDTNSSVSCEATYNGKVDGVRTFTATSGGVQYCTGLLGAMDQNTLRVGVGNPVAYCTDPSQTGDPIVVTPPNSYATTITSPNFSGTVAAAHSQFSIKMPDNGAIGLKVFCNSAQTRSANCRAGYTSAAGFGNKIGNNYCYKANALFQSGQGNLIIPDPDNSQECFDAGAAGDQFTLFVTPNSNGTLIGVPANNFEITKSDATPFVVAIPTGSAIYIKAFCDGDKTSAGVCQAVYNGNNSFRDIAGDFCGTVFGVTSGTYTAVDGSLHVPNSGAGTCVAAQALLKNETTGKLYYLTLQSALMEAGAGESVKSLAVKLNDSGVIFATGLAAGVHGGYAALGDAAPTGYTDVTGPVSILTGSLTIDRLRIL